MFIGKTATVRYLLLVAVFILIPVATHPTLAESPLSSILPQVQELNWVSADIAGVLPSEMEVFTDSIVQEEIGGALGDLIPLAWLSDEERAFYAPSYNDQGYKTSDRLFPTVGASQDRVHFLSAEELDQNASTNSGMMLLIDLSCSDSSKTNSSPASALLQKAYQLLKLAHLSDVPIRRLVDMPNEGYYMASGEISGSGEAIPVVIAASTSRRGLLYAVGTWVQLTRASQAIPHVEVMDWPDYPVRGVIEGFYGPPWSAADRLNVMSFLPSVKMNTYVYAPKNDLYHRAKWQVLYPKNELAQLEGLNDLAQRYQIDLVYAISPGLSISFSSDTDFSLLLRKIEQVQSIGINQFALLFDDIPNQLQDANDRARFGSDVGGAQAYLINRLYSYLQAQDPECKLIVVPTEYSRLEETQYKRVFSEQVNSNVAIYWTGSVAVSPLISSKMVGDATRLWKHPILLWDNYPVNDYAPESLHLAPLEGRSPIGQPGFLGFTFNPMNQAEASKLPLATAADYAWNSTSYNPDRSWETAVQRLVTPDLQDAFTLFSQNYFSSRVKADATFASAIQKLLLARSYSDEAASQLKSVLQRMAGLSELSSAVRAINPQLAEEIRPWAKKLSFTAELMQEYLSLIDQKENVAGRVAWLDRYRQWEALPEQAGPLANSLQSFREFVTKPLRLLTGSGPKASSNLPTYHEFAPERMVDGRDDTFFWGKGTVDIGDWIQLDLGQVQQVRKIHLSMASKKGAYARANDYLQHFVIEVSPDGSEYHPVGRFDLQRKVDLQLSTFQDIRYVRLVATESQQGWVQVTRFWVEPQSHSYTPALKNGDIASSEALSFVIDGNLQTEISISPVKPQTVTLTVTPASQLQGVEGLVAVLDSTWDPADGSISLQIQEKSNGAWFPVAQVQKSAALVKWSKPKSLAGFRLTWEPGNGAATSAKLKALVVREFYPLLSSN